MLISFSVQNYRSFASRQTFSMVAGASAKKKERVSFPSNNSIAPDILRSACLFGPNAAGKSSLVKALGFYSDFVVSSAKGSQEGEKIDVTPFKLDKHWLSQPSEFEAIFIHDGVLYQYGFAVDSERIWEEWLFSNPNAPGKNKRTLFQREFDPDANTYVWYTNPTHVRGEKELWKKSTRDNALFLSTAISLKSETFRTLFDWIQQHLRVIDAPEMMPKIFTAKYCEDSRDTKKKVLDLLHSVDIQIQDFDVDFGEFDPKSLPDIISSVMREKITNEMKGKLILNRLSSYHEGADGELVAFDMEEESDGTQVLFNLAGPWLDVLENGYTLIVDELHNSLHPHALKALVNLFHDPKINKNNAQLIFTSHETSVMTKEFMHQDQVWLIEKNNAEQSKLRPLSDYKVRDVAGFQKAYLNGRFGAVPKLKEFVDG